MDARIEAADKARQLERLEQSEDSDDEPLNLEVFEHNEGKYFRDSESHKIFSYDTKHEIGLYNQGADEIDFYDDADE